MPTPTIFCGFADIQLFLKAHPTDFIEHYNGFVMADYPDMKMPRDGWVKSRHTYHRFLKER